MARNGGEIAGVVDEIARGCRPTRRQRLPVWPLAYLRRGAGPARTQESAAAGRSVGLGRVAV